MSNSYCMGGGEFFFHVSVAGDHCRMSGALGQEPSPIEASWTSARSWPGLSLGEEAFVLPMQRGVLLVPGSLSAQRASTGEKSQRSLEKLGFLRPQQRNLAPFLRRSSVLFCRLYPSREGSREGAVYPQGLTAIGPAKLSAALRSLTAARSLSVSAPANSYEDFTDEIRWLP